MAVDFEGDLESVPGMSFSLQTTRGPGTMESQHISKKKETMKEDRIINADGSQANLGGPCGRCVGFSYSVPTETSNREAYINRIQLIFEEDLEYVNEQKIDKMKKDHIENEELKDEEEQKDKTPLPNHKREYEYIVIYVHFIDRLIKRLDTKGFQILLDATDIEGVKLAIVTDPNGIQIRFLEMSDNHLSQNKSAQWYARFGYYILESKDADASVALYEQLFQARLRREAGKAQVKVEEEVVAKVNLRKVGAAQTVKAAFSKGSGFRLVDMDEFVIGLVNTVFYWLGNDMRVTAPCLCFTEVSNADTGVKMTEHIPSKSPLVAIGIFSINKVSRWEI
jgi:predicted enzyme related to lactoylglutathione lyase